MRAKGEGLLSDHDLCTRLYIFVELIDIICAEGDAAEGPVGTIVYEVVVMIGHAVYAYAAAYAAALWYEALATIGLILTLAICSGVVYPDKFFPGAVRIFAQDVKGALGRAVIALIHLIADRIAAKHAWILTQDMRAYA